MVTYFVEYDIPGYKLYTHATHVTFSFTELTHDILLPASGIHMGLKILKLYRLSFFCVCSFRNFGTYPLLAQLFVFKAFVVTNVCH